MATNRARMEQEAVEALPYSDCGATNVPFQAQSGTGGTVPYGADATTKADAAEAAMTLLDAVKRAQSGV